MAEILSTAGHVLLATVFFVAPGVACWLVVAGLLVAVRRFRHSNLYLFVRNRVSATASHLS